jgi:hypothetical protein
MTKRWAVLVVALVVLAAPALAAPPAFADEVADLKRAAKAGEAEAQYHLGVKYEYGQGVDKDYGVAADWTRKAAEQGYADAQYNLGLMHEYGQGVAKSLAEADKWYAKAAAQGMEGAIQARTILEHKRNPPPVPAHAAPKAEAVRNEQQSAGDPRTARPSPFGSGGARGQDRLRNYQREREKATKGRPDRPDR